MSFSVTVAGTVDHVAAQLGRDEHPAFRHGGKLAELTQRFLADVAALAPSSDGQRYGKALIVETNGHADSNTVSLTVRVATVYDWPDPQPAPDPTA